MGSFRHEVKTQKHAFELFPVARTKPAARQRFVCAGHPEGVDAPRMHESDAA
jgi:hypothetical protein